MHPPSSDEVRTIIREAADRHAIRRRIALAFAWVESRHDPTLEGDIGWHLRKSGALYHRHVLGNADLACNPARDQPDQWHSYGLFQLLAPYHVRPLEHPRRLLDPHVNADRGCEAIAHLLLRTSGDVQRARFGYIGGGLDGERISAGHRILTSTRLSLALSRFGHEKEIR